MRGCHTCHSRRLQHLFEVRLLLLAARRAQAERLVLRRRWRRSASSAACQGDLAFLGRVLVANREHFFLVLLVYALELLVQLDILVQLVVEVLAAVKARH